MCHDQGVTEEKIIERLEKIQEELKAYKEQLDSLKHDLKLVFKHRPSLRMDVLAPANQGELMTATIHDKCLSPEEVADRLRVTKGTVLELISTRELKAIKINKRLFRIEPADFEEFKDKRKLKTI